MNTIVKIEAITVRSQNICNDLAPWSAGARRPQGWRCRWGAGEFGAYVAQGAYPRRERIAIVFDDVVEFAEKRRSFFVCKFNVHLGRRQPFVSHLFLAFASATVCHCRFATLSGPPQASATM